MKRLVLSIFIGLTIISSLFIYRYNYINKDKEINGKIYKMYLDNGNGDYDLSNSKTFPTDGYVLNTEKTKCDNGSKIMQNADKSISVNLGSSDACSLYFDWKNNQCSSETCEFDYTGNAQRFIAPKDGTYTLEVWGASGGQDPAGGSAGYGGYSVGNISMKKGENYYVFVGGKGTVGYNGEDGGYNGGGNSPYVKDASIITSGGGATSIQSVFIKDGQLKNYKDNIKFIIIVTGGGGGNDYGSYANTISGSGGGFKGGDGQFTLKYRKVGSLGYGGTQNSRGNSTTNGPGKFGIGGDSIDGTGAGGGGLYGGGAGWASGGGSGYIGNPLLTNKHMAGYNVETSDEESTKTISVTCENETATKDCAKLGNGYAKITYVSSS